MHIAEGILSLPVLAGSSAVSVCATYIGLKKLDNEQIITTALLAAAFFVASLVHVPLGPGSVHLILNGLLGIMLGWAAVPAVAVALLLQTLLFGYGGLTTLGINVVIMAGPALAVHYLYGSWMHRSGNGRLIASFAAGSTAVLLSALLVACSLISTDQSFVATAKLIIASHLPTMIIEGTITMFIVSFLCRVQPEILQPLGN